MTLRLQMQLCEVDEAGHPVGPVVIRDGDVQRVKNALFGAIGWMEHWQFEEAAAVEKRIRQALTEAAENNHHNGT